MLASLLYPYDDDVPELIDGWLAELEREECLDLYKVEGSTYIQIRNWLIHQKIDKPSQSKLPEFDERYRVLAKPREASTLEVDLEVDLEGKGGGGNSRGAANAPPSAPPPPKGSRLAKDWTLPAEWREWALQEQPTWSPEHAGGVADQFRDYWVAKTGRDATKADWEATWRNWVRKEPPMRGSNGTGQAGSSLPAIVWPNKPKEGMDHPDPRFRGAI